MPSSGLADYYHLTFKARATVGGKDFPVSSFSIRYTLNQITSGSLHFPIGKQMTGSNSGQSSNVEGFLSTLNPYTPVELFVTIVPGLGAAAPKGKGAGFPKGEFKLFTGFSAMPAFNRQVRSGGAGNASLELQVSGFAVALAGATQATTDGLLYTSKTGTTKALATFGSVAPEATLYDTLQALESPVFGDIWKKGISPILNVLLSQIDAFSVEKGSSKSIATQAFSRITNPTPLTVSTTNLTDAALPLLNQGVIKTITDGIYPFEPGNKVNADFWSIIQTLGDTFLYHFVSTVKEDIIALVVPCLKGAPFLVIDPNEYFAINTQSRYSNSQYALINTVGVMGHGLQPNAWQSSTVPSQIVGGHSAILPNNSRGRLILIDAPSWIVPRASPAKNSLGVGSPVEDVGNVKKTGAPESDQGKAEGQFLGEGLGNLYAQTIFFQELFKERSVGLVGRFRVDVCPGSLIQLNSTGLNFGGKSDTIFGMVYGMSIEAGDVGNGGYAQTELLITHVRSDAEHKNGELTTNESPLYGGAFRGKKLLDF